MAKKQYDPNKKHYFTQLKGNENIPIYVKACNDKLTIQIWPEGGNEDKLEEYDFHKVDEEQSKIFLRGKGLLKKFSKSKLTGKKVFAKFTNGSNNFFTHTLLEQENDGQFSISSSSTIYQTVQRKDYRLDAGPQTSIQLKVSENVVMDCFDISAGGCSFHIPDEQTTYFPKGKEFTNCILRLNTDIFEIPLVKVMSLRELNGTRNELKVGTAFMDMDAKLDEKLCKAITLEAKAVEIRKILLKDKKNN